jgi:hypothetical protein
MTGWGIVRLTVRPRTKTSDVGHATADSVDIIAKSAVVRAPLNYGAAEDLYVTSGQYRPYRSWMKLFLARYLDH